MREPKRIITSLQACGEASKLLKAAGFELVNASMQSEATYYRFPGRSGVIRVATHSFGGDTIGLDRVLAKLTFLPHKLSKIPDTLVITEHNMHELVCRAIGRYMIASNSNVLTTYRRWQTEETV